MHRLSHNHERQYYFVLQSLLLWREVLAHMFQLWHLAEEDLLGMFDSFSEADSVAMRKRVCYGVGSFFAVQTSAYSSTSGSLIPSNSEKTSQTRARRIRWRTRGRVCTVCSLASAWTQLWCASWRKSRSASVCGSAARRYSLSFSWNVLIRLSTSMH